MESVTEICLKSTLLHLAFLCVWNEWPSSPSPRLWNGFQISTCRIHSCTFPHYDDYPGWVELAQWNFFDGFCLQSCVLIYSLRSSCLHIEHGWVFWFQNEIYECNGLWIFECSEYLYLVWNEAICYKPLSWFICFTLLDYNITIFKAWFRSMQRPS